MGGKSQSLELSAFESAPDHFEGQIEMISSTRTMSPDWLLQVCENKGETLKYF